MNREVVSKTVLKTLEAVFNKSAGDENIKDSAKLIAYIIEKDENYRKAMQSIGSFNENEVETNTRFLTLGAKVVSEISLLVENYSNENRWHSFVFEIMARHEKFNLNSKNFQDFMRLTMEFVSERVALEDDTRSAWKQLFDDFCEQTKMALALLGLKDRVISNGNGE